MGSPFFYEYVARTPVFLSLLGCFVPLPLPWPLPLRCFLFRCFCMVAFPPPHFWPAAQGLGALSCEMRSSVQGMREEQGHGRDGCPLVRSRGVKQAAGLHPRGSLSRRFEVDEQKETTDKRGRRGIWVVDGGPCDTPPQKKSR
jgi:hypothetical protein